MLPTQRILNFYFEILASGGILLPLWLTRPRGRRGVELTVWHWQTEPLAGLLALRSAACRGWVLTWPPPLPRRLPESPQPRRSPPRSPAQSRSSEGNWFFFSKKKTAGCGALSGKRDLMWAHEFRCDAAAPCCAGAVMCQVIRDCFVFLIWHFFLRIPGAACVRDQHPCVCCWRRPVCTYIVIVEAASRHVDRLRRGPIWVAEPVRGEK